MKVVRLLWWCLIFIAGLNRIAMADDSEVYESLADVDIGRVFLTAEQRAGLDARRGKAATGSSSAASRGRARDNKHPDAAGYIVNARGTARVWSRGNFVVADANQRMRFPGDVKVRRVREDDSSASGRDGNKDDEH